MSLFDAKDEGARDVVGVVKGYVLQETLGPLRRVGKALAYGLSGAILAAVGATLVLFALLRLLQTETGRVFAGSWSFAPYLLVVVISLTILAALVLGWAKIGSRGEAKADD